MISFKRLYFRFGRLSRKVRDRKNKNINFTTRVLKTIQNFKYIEKNKIIKLNPNIKSVYNREYSLLFAERLRFTRQIESFKQPKNVFVKKKFKRDKYTIIRIFADNPKTLYENTLYIITFLRSNKYAIIYKRSWEKIFNNHWFKLLKSPHIHKKAWGLRFRRKILCIKLVVRFYKKKTFFLFCCLAKQLSKYVYIQIDE